MTTKHPTETERGLSLATSSSAGTTVSAFAVAGTDIILSYNTLSGNQPSTYSNTAFLWQNPSAIPYNQAPLASQAVPTNTQSGSMDFGGLQIQSVPYTIGYATGPNVTDICSWVSIPGSSGPNTTFQTSVWTTPQAIQPNAVLVYYDTPVGNQPQTSGQWIGIWQGTIPSYTVAPLAKVAVNNNNSTSQVALMVTLLRGTSYCLGYFMGAKQTTLAASFNFATAA
jgi:hypothetical protein